MCSFFFLKSQNLYVLSVIHFIEVFLTGVYQILPVVFNFTKRKCFSCTEKALSVVFNYIKRRCLFPLRGKVSKIFIKRYNLSIVRRFSTLSFCLASTQANLRRDPTV